MWGSKQSCLKDKYQGAMHTILSLFSLITDGMVADYKRSTTAVSWICFLQITQNEKTATSHLHSQLEPITWNSAVLNCCWTWGCCCWPVLVYGGGGISCVGCIIAGCAIGMLWYCGGLDAPRTCARNTMFCLLQVCGLYTMNTVSTWLFALDTFMLIPSVNWH